MTQALSTYATQQWVIDNFTPEEHVGDVDEFFELMKPDPYNEGTWYIRAKRSFASVGEITAFNDFSYDFNLWDSMPAATDTTIGGIIVGDGLLMNEGVLSIDGDTFNLTNYYTKTEANNKFSLLGHIHGIVDVTGLQTALDGKQATITGAATTIISSDLTADKALISNSSGKVAVSNVTSTELGYLSGVTSGIQIQLGNKLNKSVWDTYFEIVNEGLSNEYIRAKKSFASVGEITAFNGDALSGSIWDSMPAATANTLGGIKVGSGLVINNGVLSVNGSFASTWGTITGTLANQTDLQNALNAKANTSHSHSLDTLSNVAITSNSDGEILRWNATLAQWVNNTLAEAGIQPAGAYLLANQTITLSGDSTGTGTTAITVTNTGLRGSSIPSLSTGYLRYTGTVWEFKNETYSLSTHDHSATYEPLITPKSAGYLKYTGSAWSFVNEAYSLSNHVHTGTYQPLDDDLTAIAGLTGTNGFLKKISANTWGLDTSTYITGNQTITLSSDVSGSGATSIAVTVSGIRGYSVPSLTTGYLRFTGSVWEFKNETYSVSTHTHSGTYEPLITPKSTGYLRYTGSGWEFLNEAYSLSSHTHNQYITGNQTITLSGDASGSGTTAITVSVNGIKGASVPALSTGYLRYTGTVWEFKNETYSLSSHNHSSTYQPLDPDLTAIAGLTGTTGFLKKTAADTWALDTNSYLTGN